MAKGKRKYVRIKGRRPAPSKKKERERRERLLKDKMVPHREIRVTHPDVHKKRT